MNSTESKSLEIGHRTLDKRCSMKLLSCNITTGLDLRVFPATVGKSEVVGKKPGILDLSWFLILLARVCQGQTLANLASNPATLEYTANVGLSHGRHSYYMLRTDVKDRQTTGYKTAAVMKDVMTKMR